MILFVSFLFVCVCLCLCVGELQSQLCAVFGSADTCYSGSLSGDVYKWKGHNLTMVIKRAHHVRD